MKLRIKQLLGAFAKLRKATISLFMSGFSWILIFDYFSKKLEKIQVSLKSDKNNGYFTWRPLDIFDHISLIYS